jgi:hypothetical protein
MNANSRAETYFYIYDLYQLTFSMYKKHADRKRAVADAFFFVEEATGLQKSTIRKIIYKTEKYLNNKNILSQRASILPRIEFIAKTLASIYAEQLKKP